jgi:DNA modification methylase
MTKKLSPPPDWPATRPEMWALDRIKPYERNPRVHSPEMVAALAADMVSDGVTMPILVDEAGVIIAGHARRAAAELNRFAQYPVVIANGWTEEQKRSARIRDNTRALQSTWSPELIQLEIADLKLAGYDLPLLGFPESQLRGWGISLGTDSAQDPEAVPERPKKPVVRRGDLWELGPHRLYCGDATSKSDVAMCLGDAHPHLMVTDPPYGVDYDPAWRADANKWKGSIVKLGAKAMGTVRNDDSANWLDAWNLFGGDVAYVWHGGLHSSEQSGALEKSGFVIRSQIVWNKGRLVISRGDYHWQHECCWYAVRKGKTGHWEGSRTESTVWDIPKPQTSETGHGTQKPVECMKRPIQNNSKLGEAVYEPFSGSGTTIIAAEMIGRKVLAIEIDPSYVQVAIERWQTFTSKLATCDGKTLDQVAAARRKGKANGSKRKHPPLRANSKGDGLRDAGVDTATDVQGNGTR